MSSTMNSVFLLNDGTARIVGYNYYGECATGSSSNAQLTLYNPGLIGVKQIACGYGHTVYLLNDGTVRTVGYNTFGQCGTGSVTGSAPYGILTLYTIPGLSNVKQISCGYGYTVFVLNDGTVRTVGHNAYGQCGTGAAGGNQLTLYTIPGLSNVDQAFCGWYHTVFLLKDGTVRAIGQNQYGQCATGNVNPTSPYGQLTLYNPGLSNVKEVACGAYHTVFLLKDGTVRTVGYNNVGQCGTGNVTTPQLTLYTIPGLSNVKQISCGYGYTVFVLNDGTVRTVGDNSMGQCGTGSTSTQQLTLYNPTSLTNVKQISCGYYHTVFLLNDGTIKTVGYNEYGQCSTGVAGGNQLAIYTIPTFNTTKSLWSVSIVAIIKYLLKQYNNYFSIKPEYYDTGGVSFTPLSLANGTTPSSNEITNYGFDDLNILTNQMTVSSQTFKPIDKLPSNFDIKTYIFK